LDKLNESTNSLSLDQNILSNLSHSVEKQNDFLKSFAVKSFELQDKLIRNQEKHLNLLENIVTQNTNRATSSNLETITIESDSKFSENLFYYIKCDSF
jgi:hypothetical protein